MKCQCGIYNLLEGFYLGEISLTNDAGRFIILPPSKINYSIPNNLLTLGSPGGLRPIPLIRWNDSSERHCCLVSISVAISSKLPIFTKTGSRTVVGSGEIAANLTSS